MNQLYANIAGRKPPPSYNFLSRPLPLTLSRSPSEYVTKIDTDFSAACPELTAYRDDRSRSSSLFHSTRF